MNINTTYLLTGAAGFLGINICTQLIERGEHIRAFVLKGDPARKYLPAEVEVFEGDLCSAEDCEAFFNIPEGSQSVCIHCASMVTIDPGYSEKLIAVNVGGTENMLAAADKGRKGECYILSNDEVTLKEMCRMLKEDTGCKGCKFYLPLSFAHLAAKQMEKSAAKKGTKPVLTEFAVYNLERNNTFDCSKAKNELGFAPRPYAETLHDTAAWLKATGKIK